MDLHPAISPGRVAVVTGAASGIGLAAAHRFAEAGMRVVLADVAAEPLGRAADALRSAGREALAVPTDVSRREEVARLAEAARGFGDLAVVMCNAGVEGGGAILGDVGRWERILGVNLWGAIHTIQLLVPDLVASGRPGAVICTGSKQGITLPPGDTAYNVSKAALKALTESLAHDLRNAGGRVTAHLLIPGFTFTGFTRARGVTEKPPGAWTPEQVIDFLMPAMARGDFYVLCPDGEVTRELDEKRIRWATDDLLLNRPPLSRWHPDWQDAFRAFVARK